MQFLGGITGMWGNTAASRGLAGSAGYANYQGARHGLESVPSHMKSSNAPEMSQSVCNHYGNVIDGSQVDTEREDLLDQHVAYFMRHHPEVQKRHTFVRSRPGVYNFDGREIQVEWHYSEEPDQPGFLYVIDGPLRQPFADYMANNENGVLYDDKRLVKSSLQQIAKGQRLSFGDANKMYTRLEAMKVAKEQALVREQAAEFAQNGYAVPQQELMQKYKKNISQKLGQRRQRPEPKQEQPPPLLPAEAPVPVPVAPPAPELRAPAAVPTPARAAPNASKETYGKPKYCSQHNKTENRKKCAPEKKPCSSCSKFIQTNYAQFALCPECSERDNRCMCCGAGAEGRLMASPEAKATQAKASKGEGEKHGNPKYCAQHNKTENRKKGAPEKRPCSKCHAKIQTNYKMFELCPACSEKDNRCMCCGAPAVSLYNPAPAEAPSTPLNMQSSPQNKDGKMHQSAPSGTNLFGMPNLFSELQGNSGGAFGTGVFTSTQRMPQQNNAYATNNVFMSQNPMASGPMASQNYYTNPMTSQNGAFVSYRRM